MELISFFQLADKSKNSPYFVKIISLENGNFDLALRKRLFCAAKPTLLPCKTATFGMQNNRFCNTLITRRLHKRYSCEKYLHFYDVLYKSFLLIDWHTLEYYQDCHSIVRVEKALSEKLGKE